MQVRIIPENREALKREAQKNLRSIQGEANQILTNHFALISNRTPGKIPEMFPIPNFGEHLPIEKCKTNPWMLNGDGSCYFATKTHYSRERASLTNIPKWATHVIYFGK